MKKLCYVFLFALIVHADYVNAQTITIGSGNTSNGVTTASPVNIYFRRQISQMVYTVAELNAAGISQCVYNQ